VNDYAGLLQPAERQRIESFLAEREAATGTQMAIALFRSLEGESVEDVANRLFQKWRLGHKGLDNGVLLVVFVQDRKLRIEVGYGLEAALTDAEADQIIRNAIAPRFREGRYVAGLEAAVVAVYGRIAPGGARPPIDTGARERRQARGESSAQIYLLALLGLIGVTVGGLALEASRQRGYTAARRGWGRSGPGVWYGGGWGSGGGGGWSGGGGFSGGGGSSGGGGASGSW
jgi:uncharacterized protein